MRISIITVSLNSESTIERTIKSVINQKSDLYDLEYILIDGASHDNTMNIVDKYRNNIDVIVSEPDEGISDAFNKGIRLSSGDLIGIINSDDYLVPGALETIFRNYEENIDVYYGNGYRLNADGSLSNYDADTNLNRLKYDMRLFHPGVFVTSKAYARYGAFDKSLKCVMDRDLLLRIYLNGGKFKYINSKLAVYSGMGVSNKQFFSIVVKENEWISIQYGMNRFIAKIITIVRILYFKFIFYYKKEKGKI